jgi:hypothetical protein
VRVDALPAANSLRVSGSEEDVRKVQEIVALLDKPAKRVQLQVELLQGTPSVLDKLKVAGWSHEGQDANDAAVLRFTTGEVGKLCQQIDQTGGTLCAAGRLVASMGSSLDVYVGEVSPLFSTPAEAGAAGAGIAAHFLSLRLVPRVNADNSVTVLIEALSVVGETRPPDATRLAPQTRHIVGNMQVRAASGEAIAVALPLLTDAQGQPVDDDAFLARPVLLITPRVLESRVSETASVPNQQ